MITIAIDDQLLAEAQAISKQKAPIEIVTKALEEYILYRKQLQILDMFGVIDYDEQYDYKKQRKRL